MEKICAPIITPSIQRLEDKKNSRAGNAFCTISDSHSICKFFIVTCVHVRARKLLVFQFFNPNNLLASCLH
jgi:hypothetical protein